MKTYINMELIQFSLALIFYFFVHSFLAHKKIKQILIPQWISYKYYRVFFNVLAIILLIPIYFFYKKTIPIILLKIGVLSVFGGFFIIIGGILLLLSLKQYNLSEFLGIEQYRNNGAANNQKLNTQGLNKWVRHPLYFSTLLIIWGLFLLKSTITIFLLSFITTLYLYWGTKLEEEKLVEEFGKEYEVYQKRVPMLLPFLK